MKPQIMNNWDPPDTVHARVVADQFGGTYEILVLCILSIVGAILHGLFMWNLWKMKNTLTLRLLWLSSTFQVFYIFAIGIPGISHLIFREWIFGFAACKAFLSLKTISSGVCINVTVAIIGEKMFGIMMPIKRYQWALKRYYQVSIISAIIALSITSGLPRFYLAGSVVDIHSNKTECVGHDNMTDTSQIMHLCWCIYVLVVFFIVPICISLICSCYLACRYSQPAYRKGPITSDISIVGSWNSLSTSETLSLSSQGSAKHSLSPNNQLHRLAMYTTIDTVIYLICWGPLHVTGLFSKLIQEEMMFNEMEDTILARFITALLGPHREDHLICLHRLVIISRLFHHIYFCAWPFLHLNRIRNQ